MDRESFEGVERGEESCAGCAARLSAAPAAYAVLVPEGEGWRRRDYCGACFEKLPVRPFSFWKRSPPSLAEDHRTGEGRRAARRRDLDALMELFERLSAPGAEKGPEREKLRYLLALALCRKKRLHLVELARAGGADCLVLRTSGEAELMTVPAPALTRDELDRLARDLETEVGLS